MDYARPYPPFDPARVTGWTVAIACNLLVLGLLARGVGDPWSAAAADEPASTPVDWIVPAIPPPPPPPESVPEVRRMPQSAAVHSPPVASPESRPLDRPATPADPRPEAVPTGIGQPASGEAPGTTGGDGLAYADAPAPRYPADALRRGWEGTVWLRVRVDEAGRPVEVEIERSSGHASLDRAARQQVRDRWRFQPAVRDGRPVPAWGRVPIRFSLGAG